MTLCSSIVRGFWLGPRHRPIIPVNPLGRALRKLIGEETGVAAVEAALVVPVLVLFGFGVLEFSNGFFDHQQVTTGVRDAARYLARVSDPTDATSQGYAKNLAVSGAIAGGKARVAGWTVANVTIAIANVANPINPATGELTYRGANPLKIVTVSTSFPYRQMGFLTAFGLATPPLTVAHSERWIGG
jgi:Flp pilus assembly protein TadG